ncbi:hypothetical protein OKW30_001188 [Paraburkholderia sp. Clong3]
MARQVDDAERQILPRATERLKHIEPARVAALAAGETEQKN